MIKILYNMRHFILTNWVTDKETALSKTDSPKQEGKDRSCKCVHVMTV